MGFKQSIRNGSPFTLQNIPFGVISTHTNPIPRCAIAIGDYALDLKTYGAAGHLDGFDSSLQKSLEQPTLNDFAALPSSTRTAVRSQIIKELQSGSIAESCFVPLDKAIMHLPMRIGGFSDFTCSLEHVTNCAPMAGGTIPQSFFTMPLVYNGRASSIVPTNYPIKRPMGVIMDRETNRPVYTATKALDYELEMGFFISKPVKHGETVKIENSKEHIFGFVLLNDWSGRDIQAFEMNPLGPFNGKGSATTISPWIVTLDALEQFSCPSIEPNPQNPSPADHLLWRDEKSGTFDIHLKSAIIRNGVTYHVTKSNLRYLYWNPFQMLTHHASAMCGLQSGDLVGTGTISGAAVDENGKKLELGCLFEATKGGTAKLTYDDNTEIGYLEDGDELVMEAWCTNGESGSNVAIGFGDCRGLVLPASTESTI